MTVPIAFQNRDSSAHGTGELTAEYFEKRGRYLGSARRIRAGPASTYFPDQSFALSL